jgi:two-component system sensor histidine kinase KdpD
VLGSRRAWIELGSLRQAGPDESAHDLAVGGRHIGRLYLDEDVRLAASATTRLLPGIASMLAVACEREELARTAVEAETLRRSDEIKTAVLRSVSHDLRSPLTAIRAARDGLENPSLSLSEADREELQATMRAATDRLDRLVSNLLDLSRLESGAATARPELWTVDALVGRALETVGATAERVEVALAAELPPVRADAAQLERALANLLENALGVSSRCLVEAEPMLDEVVVRVTDDGPGLDPADLERIFLPFERGAAARRGGSGLGLSIARGFVEANGGRIWAEARPDAGATFAVALPAAPIPATVAAG